MNVDRLARAWDVAANMAWLSSTLVIAAIIVVAIARNPRVASDVRCIAYGSAAACLCVAAVRLWRDVAKLVYHDAASYFEWLLWSRWVLGSLAVGVVLFSAFALWHLLNTTPHRWMLRWYFSIVACAAGVGGVWAYLVPW